MAVVWLALASRTTHTPLPSALLPTMFLAVWLLYATDRLLDARPLTTRTAAKRVPQVPAQPHHADPGLTLPLFLQPRHRFHHANRRTFAFVILSAAAILAILIPTLPATLLRPYLALATLLALWFGLIHLTHLSLPKEFAPGLFFAAAVFIPLPHATLPAILFATLCTVNCLYIHAWEHPQAPTGVCTDLPRNTTAPATRLALRCLPQLTLTLILVPLLHATPLTLAISLSSLVLLALHHYHRHLSPTTLRAAADLALLSPALILPWLT